MPMMNEPGFYRPCLILAHGNALYAADTCKRFRRQGWDVYEIEDGPAARRLARMLEPELVVLEADLKGESGWLTCAKLTRERPGSRVILVSDESGASNCRKADFVGAAALVHGQDSLLPLAEAPAARRAA
jgi:DNA-binding response OmpR family regulator